jgi:hypothetical protein
MASISWQPGIFRIVNSTDATQAEGFIGGPFGIREEPRRWHSVWTVTHLASGLRVTLGNGSGFLQRAMAQEFAERLLPLADWDQGRALADNDALADQVVDICNELITRDVAAAQEQHIARLLRVNDQRPSKRRAKR